MHAPREDVEAAALRTLDPPAAALTFGLTAFTSAPVALVTFIIKGVFGVSATMRVPKTSRVFLTAGGLVDGEVIECGVECGDRKLVKVRRFR